MDSVVVAKFNHQVAKSQYQFTGSGFAAVETNVNDQGTTGDGLAFDLKVSKPLWNFSADEFIGANELKQRSVELKLKASLMDHLLSVNNRLLNVRLMLIEKAVIAAQVKELDELGKFADRLMRSRVIDPADALLVKENLIRFQLRQLEVDEALNDALTSLAVESGIKREKFKKDDLSNSNVAVAKVEVEYQSARNRIRELNAKLNELPRTLAAANSQLAFEKEYRSVERTWYPKLVAEAGARRLAGPMSIESGQLEGYLGLALNFSLPTQLVSADLERIQALKDIESERERRSAFEYKNVLISKFDQMGILLNQFKTAIQRKENLERLLDLQLVKFKSGKLSFLNVNDVMLSLLEARRQTGASRARILSIDNDAAIISSILDQRDLFKTDLSGRSCD